MVKLGKSIVKKSLLYLVTSFVLFIVLYFLLTFGRGSGQGVSTTSTSYGSRSSTSTTTTNSPFSHIIAINRLKRLDRQKRLHHILKNAINLSPITDYTIQVATDKDTDWASNQRAQAINNMNVGEIAVYASHVAALSRVVRDQLPYTLILEDDVDMDVNMINQVKSVMYPLKSPFNTSLKALDWDIVYFGHCLEERNNPREILYRSLPIPPPPRHIWSKHPALSKAMTSVFSNPYSDQVFGLAKAVRPLCLHAYAVSLPGALKILSAIPVTTPEIHLQIDDTIADLFGAAAAASSHDVDVELKGYTVNPQMIIQKRKGIKSDLRPDSYLYDLGEPEPLFSATESSS